MERRRGARIPARFWVQIAGVDEVPVLRRGDISMSGVYVELDRPIGPPGSVQRLTLSPHDREATLELLARVVRLVSIQDLWHDGPGIAGVAFEFLPDAARKRELLGAVIRHVMASRSFVAESIRIESGFEAQISAHVVAPEEATITGVRTMVLETGRAMSVGDDVACDIVFAGDRVSVTGRVARVTEEQSPAGTRYRVALDFRREPEREESAESAGLSISDAMGTLLEDAVFPEPSPAASPIEGLNGSLERVRLGDLLTFLEAESLSGVVKVTREGSSARVWVRSGRIVDVALEPGPEEPHDALILLCSFVTGEFEYTPAAVERPDRVNASIAELMATPV